MKSHILLIVLLATLASCGKTYQFEQKFDVPNRIWNADQSLNFQVDILDTTASYNLYVRIDNTEFYPTNNLWLFAKSIAPNHTAQIDTLEIFLANNTQWLGQEKEEGIWTGLYPFKLGVGFPQSGTYHFQLVQGMRMTALEDIQAVGLVLEKISK